MADSILARLAYLNTLAAALALAAAVGTSPEANAADVSLIGLMRDRAVLVINGSKPRTLQVGEVTPEKVKLVTANSESAVVEIEGRRQTLTMGQSISLGGGPGGTKTTLTADGRGHFMVTAQVNGVSMQFIVDTGASVVTISSGDARRAGINYLNAPRGQMQTANGITTGYRVSLDTVRLNDVTLNNVEGVVVEGNVLGGIGLLGMSFLNRMEMRRDGMQMTLTKRF